MTPASKETAWERSRRELMSKITATAIDMFLRFGFEATTVRQIAEEAGVSERSMFRYIGSKEEILLAPLTAQGPELLAALELCPDTLEPWDALATAFRQLRGFGGSSEQQLALSKMLHETPSLRARSAEKHMGWQQLLLPEVRRRMGVAPDDLLDPGPAALIASALACIDAVGETWMRSGGTLDREALWARAVAAVRA